METSQSPQKKLSKLASPKAFHLQFLIAYNNQNLVCYDGSKCMEVFSPELNKENIKGQCSPLPKSLGTFHDQASMYVLQSYKYYLKAAVLQM